MVQPESTLPAETTEAHRALPETYLINTLEALKVFSDPLRQRVIETLFDGQKTVKQIAAELDIAPTKLYYHINLLEEHGLIRVVDTRIVSGIIEKQYDAAASHYRIKRSLLAPGQNDSDDGLDTTIDAIIEPMRVDIRKSIVSGLIDTRDDVATKNRQLRIWRAIGRLQPEDADRFYARMDELIDEFACQDDDAEVNEASQNYSMLMFLYPTEAGKNLALKHRKKKTTNSALPEKANGGG